MYLLYGADLFCLVVFVFVCTLCRSMARTGEVAGSSSSVAKAKGKQPAQQYKRRKYVAQNDEFDEEMQQAPEAPRLDPANKPEWKTGPLNEKPRDWQPTLFHDQIKGLSDRA